MVSLIRAGAILTLLIVNHLVADWVFQSHDTAMNKTKNNWVLASHCAIYALFFVPILVLLSPSPLWVAAGVLSLFASHMIIDTYFFTWLWARYIRRVPQIVFADKMKVIPEGWTRTTLNNYAFRQWFGTPLGAILGITIDQIQHILVLVVLACLL